LTQRRIAQRIDHRPSRTALTLLSRITRFLPPSVRPRPRCIDQHNLTGDAHAEHACWHAVLRPACKHQRTQFRNSTEETGIFAVRTWPALEKDVEARVAAFASARAEQKKSTKITTMAGLEPAAS
jgi:hypothetical protein